MENSQERNKWLSHFWLGIYVFVLAFAAFYPALQGSFLNWDDEMNFVYNTAWRGLGAANIKWMFTSFFSTHYTPLAWLTLGFDYKLWGMNPFGYHLTALLFHGAAALCLFALLRLLFELAAPESEKLHINISAVLGALFFAVHPLRVESVAWITERRDVTGGFFALLCSWLYVRAARTKERRFYFASVAAFAAALLCRESEAALAPSLLLLDWYPLGRLGESPREWFLKERIGVWIEKIPYFALAAAASLLAVIGTAREGYIDILKLPFAQRMAQFFAGLAFYIVKTIFPVGLSPFYARPGFSLADIPWSILLLVALIILAFWLRRFRALWVALGVYLLFVIPTLGAVTMTSYACDRYSYMSCIGFAGLFGAAVLALRLDRRVFYGPAIVVVALLCALSVRQSSYWGDSLTLWQRAVDIAPGSLSYQKRGEAYMELGKYAEAREDLLKAAKLYPDADVLSKLASAELRLGNPAAALDYLKQALVLEPDTWYVHLMLARAYAAAAQEQNAIAEFSYCIKAAHDARERCTALCERGAFMLKQRDEGAALSDFNSAISLEADNPAVFCSVASSFSSIGDLQKALYYYNSALKADPAYPPALAGRNALAAMMGASNGNGKN
jgi:tetratricopeptide (TPR) repeat protein